MVKQWLLIKVGERKSHFWYNTVWPIPTIPGLYIPDNHFSSLCLEMKVKLILTHITDDTEEFKSKLQIL